MGQKSSSHNADDVKQSELEGEKLSCLQAVEPISVVLEHTWPEVEINIIPPVEIRSKCQTILTMKRSTCYFCTSTQISVALTEGIKRKTSMSEHDSGVKQVRNQWVGEWVDVFHLKPAVCYWQPPVHNPDCSVNEGMPWTGIMLHHRVHNYTGDLNKLF